MTTMDIVRRENWGAATELGPMMSFPIREILIIQSNTSDTHDVHADMRLVSTRANFAIHPSGTVLEDTGLTVASAFRENQLCIVWIGNYAVNYPTPEMIRQTAELIKFLQVHEYLEKDALIRTYDVNSYRQGVKALALPGQYIHSSLPTIRALVAEKDGIEMICTMEELETVVRGAVRAELEVMFPTLLTIVSNLNDPMVSGHNATGGNNVSISD